MEGGGAYGGRVPPLFFPGDPRLFGGQRGGGAAGASGRLPLFATGGRYYNFDQLLASDPLASLDGFGGRRARKACKCPTGTKRSIAAVLFIVVVAILYLQESSLLLFGRGSTSLSAGGRKGSAGSGKGGGGGGRLMVGSRLTGRKRKPSSPYQRDTKPVATEEGEEEQERVVEEEAPQEQQQEEQGGVMEQQSQEQIAEEGVATRPLESRHSAIVDIEDGGGEEEEQEEEAPSPTEGEEEEGTKEGSPEQQIQEEAGTEAADSAESAGEEVAEQPQEAEEPGGDGAARDATDAAEGQAEAEAEEEADNDDYEAQLAELRRRRRQKKGKGSKGKKGKGPKRRKPIVKAPVVEEGEEGGVEEAKEPAVAEAPAQEQAPTETTDAADNNNSKRSGGSASSSSPSSSSTASESMPAVDWARRRILAFQSSVMGVGRKDGSRRKGSILPMHTQEEPFEQQPEFSADFKRISEHGLLMTPHYFFTKRYAVEVDRTLSAWVAEHAAASTGMASSPPPSQQVPVVQADGSFALSEGSSSDQLHSLWSPGTGISKWSVTVPSGLAPSEDKPFAELISGSIIGVSGVASAIDPDAHARSVAPCLLDHMYKGRYFHDLDNAYNAIVRENRYPPLNAVMKSGDADAIGRSVFRPADKQPIPWVMTAFDVVVGDTGYVFAPHDAFGDPGLERINRDKHPGSHESFRPIECLYREFDHGRGGGHEAVYSPPKETVEEMIVLSQYWGQHVYHLYEEDFIRLGPILDYATAHPHVKLHVKIPDDQPGPHAWLTELTQAFGLDPSRLVWGSVRGRIVHVPEGTPCGEPYAFNQAMLREALRSTLGMRQAVDLWGDGSAVAYGFWRGTSTASPAIATASGRYLKDLHKCMLRRYTSAVEAKGAAAAALPHPLASLVAAAEAALESNPLGPPTRGDVVPPAPKVVLLERTGSRHVPNFQQLKAELGRIPGINLVVFGASEPGSQADHLRSFSNADVIVGPHGAGLTNALTSWPGSVMIEFIPDSGLTNLVYMQMGLLLGFDFQSFCPLHSSYYSAVEVDVARVRQVVHDALGGG